jgi:hypothetical protein
MAKEVFSQDLPYDPAKLTKALNWLSTLEAWVKNVRSFAYEEAVAGRCPPDYKLVEKRATRKWEHEQRVIPFLRDHMGDEDIFETKLKSPAKIEKYFSKAERKDLDAFIIKQSSGTTLAHTSDKRSAVVPTTAKEVFDDGFDLF